MSQRPFRVDVPLRWSDMDAYGHVNNVQFLRLLEDARVVGFEQWFGHGTEIAGSSFSIAYEVRDPADVGTTLYARAETTLVAYDFATVSPRRLRPDERAVLKTLAGKPVSFRWRART